jgi:hypothetical protein
VLARTMLCHCRLRTADLPCSSHLSFRIFRLSLPWQETYFRGFLSKSLLMNRLFSALAIFLLIGLFTSGCQYQLGDVKGSSYAGINNIHVPIFKNHTLEPRLSSLVTNAVLKEIQADSTYTVTKRSSCDAVLVGNIREVKKRQLRSVPNDTLESQELILFLYIDFHLEDPNTGRRIESTAVEGDSYGKSKQTDGEEVITARQGRVIGETIQFLDPSYQVGERNALSFAAQDLATKLVSQLANCW